MNRFNLTPQAKRTAVTFNLTVFISLIILLTTGPIIQSAVAQSKYLTAVGATDTVYVAPPTGERETDRASILAALEEVRPGGTIQFAPGMYRIGPIIRVDIPEIILQGHPEGTIIRGCDPEKFVSQEQALFECHGLELSAARQTVRNLTIEYTWHGLFVGCCWPDSFEELEKSKGPPKSQPGGHLIEGNIFRYSPNGLRVIGEASKPTVIKNNHFIDVYHAIGINGGPVHFLNNEMIVEDPERVPISLHPGDVINMMPFSSLLNLNQIPEEDHSSCLNNIIEGNRIEGYPDGIRIVVFNPNSSCRKNIIRDNIIKVERTQVIRPGNKEDSTVVGIPIRLSNLVKADSSQNKIGGNALIRDNLITGNKIMGAEGVGLEILYASENTITNNTFIDIRKREPFPGNTLGGKPDLWSEANGSGIWLSPGSNENEIWGNSFENIASNAVFIEGLKNRVEIQDADDTVRDMGKDNLISQTEVTPDTTRFTIIINGQRQAERRMWQTEPNTWYFEHEGDAFHFPRTERLVLDTDGYPLEMEIEGQRIVWDRWIERYKRHDNQVRWTAHTQSILGENWSRTLDEGEVELSEPIYYAALHPVHDLGVLARLLLKRKNHTLDLLPEGQASLEPVGERGVENDTLRRRIRLFAIHGLDLRPLYVWLDEDDATFADEWSVLAGWEQVFPELRAASEKALAVYHRDLARDLVPPARDRPLVITGAQLFDPDSGAVEPETTIILEGARISAVGPDDSFDLPPNAEILDATGKMVLPGLWDMHAHHGFPGPYFEVMAPLYLAGGITTARDMGMPVEPMLSLQQRIQDGEALGPRLLQAGWIGGEGGRPTGKLVGNPAEARAAVDRYAALGYDQIKIYSDLPHDLVPVVIKRAKEHSLRLSGEVPGGMSVQKAVELGFEEIQHLDALIMDLVSTAMIKLRAERTPDRLGDVNKALAELTADSISLQELIQFLASEGVAVDPTLVVFAAQGMKPPPWVKRVSNGFPAQAQRRILDRHLFGYWPLSPLWDDIFKNMLSLIDALHEAGVPLLPGSDTEMGGFDLHQELEFYVQAGIPAPEVLTLATLGAARVMEMDDELGSIEPGKRADLILVDGDPTKNISDIRRVITVIKDGRGYDPAAIHRALGIEPCCEYKKRKDSGKSKPKED